jgi:hypothetical protein
MQLLPRPVSERYDYPARFEEIGPSVAHLYLCLGYDEAIELPKHIVWHMPTYEGVGPYDLDAADVLYKEHLTLDGMGGYVLSPSARDPVYTERYPDRTTVEVLAEAPYAWVERSRSDPAFKADLERRLADNLERIVHRHMPVLRDRVPVVRTAGLPMPCNPSAWCASSLGLEPSADRFVRHTHWLRPETAIAGLYLTGQDSFSMGFAGSMFSARVTYAAITGNWAFLLRKTIGRLP